MIHALSRLGILMLLIATTFMTSCTDPDDNQPIIVDTLNPALDTNPSANPVAMEVSISNVLTNQVDGVIIPTFQNYLNEMNQLLSQVDQFVTDIRLDSKPQGDGGLGVVADAYIEAYTAYQAAAAHHYFATVSNDLINTTNIYPIDPDLLNDLVLNQSFNFNSTVQQEANGFPALDYLLYGSDDLVADLQDEPERLGFMLELVTAMRDGAELLVMSWTGPLRDDFTNSIGLESGSSISQQLNGVVRYLENHIRDNKIGFVIGRGSEDNSIDPNPRHREGFFQSRIDDSDDISLGLLRAAIEEMEDIYLGATETGGEGLGYEELLIDGKQTILDVAIKDQYDLIYDIIDGSTSISTDDVLYNSVDDLIILYRSQLLPALNIQVDDQ